MSMRTALMEMAHGKKPKTERASWVPESILDDDVSHFMGAAAAAKKAGKSHFDFGGKKYKVTMKHDAAKKIAEATFATDIDYNEEDDIKKVAKRFGVKVGFVNIGGATEMQMTGDKNKIMKALKALEFTDQEIKNAYFKESAECPTCGDGECQCEQPVQEANGKLPPFPPKKRDSKLPPFPPKEVKQKNRFASLYKDKKNMPSEEAKVDELSTKTLKSYVKKASKQRDKAGDSYSAAAARRHDFAPDTPAMKKNAIKYDKRDSGVDMAKKKLAARESAEENYTDKQDASYRDEPTPKGAQKRLKALHKKALAYRKKHGKFPSDPYSAAKKSKVDLKFESVEENLAPGATAQHSATKETSDTWDKQMSNGENDIPMGKKKDFVDQHNMEVAYDAEELYKQNKYEALSKTPARPGDKSDGDKNVVNPIPTNMVDGMRAALAKMKNSGE